jgi:hypothetical protein
MNRARSLLGALMFLSLALNARPSAIQSSTAEPSRSYSVAVVRADGAMVPFARFDRGSWRPLWTGVTGESTTVPETLEKVPAVWWGPSGPVLKWTLWSGRGEPAPINVTSTRAVAAPCGKQSALGTDYAPPTTLPPADQAPFPKVGIATTAAVDFEPIPEVAREDPNWLRVRRALERREFRKAETDALTDMRWKHPTPSAIREQTPIDLQAVWHVKDSRFFYFEAMRHYRDPNPEKDQPPCPLITYVAGYFWEDPSGELRPVGVRGLITYCHMEHAAFLWPLGVIREGGKQYWLLQSSGWRGEFYRIMEPHPSEGMMKPHVMHLAGICR